MCVQLAMNLPQTERVGAQGWSQYNNYIHVHGTGTYVRTICMYTPYPALPVVNIIITSEMHSICGCECERKQEFRYIHVCMHSCAYMCVCMQGSKNWR